MLQARRNSRSHHIWLSRAIERGTIRKLHISIGRRASITVLKSQRGAWYEHKPETVTESEEVTILWDMQIHADRELSANKTDIVIKDQANRCCKLIDVSVPSDRNTSTKVIEKLSKYKDLEIETARMWGLRTESVPIIVGALGLIKEGMDQNSGNIPGASTIRELQKIIVLRTAHILRRFLSTK